MVRILVTALIVALVGWPTSATPSPLLLVKFYPLPLTTIKQEISNQGGVVAGRIAQIGVWKIRPKLGITSEELLTRFRRHPRVQFAEIDGIYRIRLTPNDPRFPQQWGPKKIRAEQGWEGTTGFEGGLIAVLDTGVDYTHPDLAGKVVLGPDYINGDGDPMDDEGHGTETSGVAAAVTNNGIGIAGLDWKAKILAIKVCNNSGWCYWSAASQGIVYAADAGAKVINMSFGGTSGSGALQSALEYAWKKGVVMSCAAGNNNGPVNYPAAYPECIAAGATDSGDNRAGFSAYGPQLEVTAPGVSIHTTTLGGHSGSGAYATYSGTSYAAPHVAGLASLLFGFRPADPVERLDHCQVREVIKRSSIDLGAVGWDPYYGWGRIDIANAMAVATIPPTPACGPPPPPPGPDLPPTVTWLQPPDGATVRDRVYMLADAADDRGISRVDFFANGQHVGSSVQHPYSTFWNTKPKKWTAGTYTLLVIATDTTGQTAQQTITVQLVR